MEESHEIPTVSLSLTHTHTRTDHPPLISNKDARITGARPVLLNKRTFGTAASLLNDL